MFAMRVVGVLVVATFMLGCSTNASGLAAEFDDASAGLDGGLGGSTLDGGGEPGDGTMASEEAGIGDSGAEPIDSTAPTETAAAVDSEPLPLDAGLADSAVSPVDSAMIATDSGAPATDSSTLDSGGFDTAGLDTAGFDTAGGSCYSLACTTASDCPAGCSRCSFLRRCAP